MMSFQWSTLTLSRGLVTPAWMTLLHWDPVTCSSHCPRCHCWVEPAHWEAWWRSGRHPPTLSHHEHCRLIWNLKENTVHNPVSLAYLNKSFVKNQINPGNASKLFLWSLIIREKIFVWLVPLVTPLTPLSSSQEIITGERERERDGGIVRTVRSVN